MNLSILLRIFGAAIAWLLLIVSLTRAGDETTTAREVAGIDLTYARAAADKGMPAASIEYFAEDGIAFAPFAVNGKKYWAARSDFPGTLIWEPIFATAAHAGDLAYTTGPWELKKKETEISPAYGHYVTIWNRNPEGIWKIALDVGTENAQPADAPGNLEILPADPIAPERSPEESRGRINQATREFLKSAQENLSKAIMQHAGEDIRIYRQQSFPAVGTAAARLLLTSRNRKAARRIEGDRLSRSGDLYYNYGNYSEDRGNTVEHGIYLTIWRTNLNGDWKIVLDLEKTVEKS